MVQSKEMYLVVWKWEISNGNDVTDETTVCNVCIYEDRGQALKDILTIRQQLASLQLNIKQIPST